MNCNKCGNEVRVVPAGVSKKTGKPYGSFYKCESCQNSVQIGVQPAKPQYQQGNAQLDRIEANQIAILGKIQELMGMMTEPDEAEENIGF